MSDPLRNFFDKLKPSFQGSGKLAKYFPLFDVFENLFFILLIEKPQDSLT
jgi:Na+-transporting NADH:ubiquinone oxidoreductase subunit NqrB